MGKFELGYTTGVFDVIHKGHINVLRNAKGLCKILIVGVSTDELVKKKGKTTIVPFEERIELVRNLKFVDVAVAQTTVNKLIEWQKLKFDVVFVGDDWFGTKTWNQYEKLLNKKGIPVIYFPYTHDVSSTLRRGQLYK